MAFRGIASPKVECTQGLIQEFEGGRGLYHNSLIPPEAVALNMHFGAFFTVSLLISVSKLACFFLALYINV